MVRDTKLYDILNINSDANENDIKKAYRKLSMKWHPDKNPNNKDEATREFHKINEAYSILSDKEKRNLYHQIGIDILKSGSDGPSIDPTKIFEQFFGGFGGFGGFEGFGGFQSPFSNNRQKQSEDCVVEKEVTLEEIYNEVTVKVEYSQKNFCKTCNGFGNLDKQILECQYCNGKGKTVEMRQLGPGMVQQFVSNCSHCNGTGENQNVKNICQNCNGKKFVTKVKSINLPLQKNLESGNQIKISGKGHNLTTGKTDLIIVIKELPHSLFTRDHYDLHVKLDIPMYQSFYGFKHIIEHLDKRKLLITNNEMIKGEGIFIIENEGMSKSNGRRGNLLVHIETIYPELKYLQENENDVLKKLLIKLNIDYFKKENKINTNECSKVNIRQVYNNQQTNNNNEHFNQEEEQVGCAQQ